MARRRFLGMLGFGTGVFAGSVLYRRSTGRRRERVDVYFDDGSMVSFRTVRVLMPAPHISGFAPQTPTDGGGMTDSRQVSQETVFWCIRRPVLSSGNAHP